MNLAQKGVGPPCLASPANFIYGLVLAEVLSHVTIMPVLLRPVNNFLCQVIGNASEGKYNTVNNSSTGEVTFQKYLISGITFFSSKNSNKSQTLATGAYQQRLHEARPRRVVWLWEPEYSPPLDPRLRFQFNCQYHSPGAAVQLPISFTRWCCWLLSLFQELFCGGAIGSTLIAIECSQRRASGRHMWRQKQNICNVNIQKWPFRTLKNSHLWRQDSFRLPTPGS